MNFLIIPGILLILYLISLPSSPKPVVISHDEFMNKFKTTDDVLKEFGLPDSKKELNGFEEWLYKKDKVIIRHRSKNGKNQNFTIGGGGMYKDKYPIGGFNTSTSDIEDETETIREEKSYIKFIIKKDKIINWDTKGLDFTKAL